MPTYCTALSFFFETISLYIRYIVVNFVIENSLDMKEVIKYTCVENWASTIFIDSQMFDLS